MKTSDYKNILDQLVECEADVNEILRHLERLQLYDYSLSLRDIAKILRLSKTRVKQIESKALKKIKEGLA